MNDRRIRIAIADDHPVVRRGLRAYLDALPEFVVVIDVGDGAALEVALHETSADVALIDLLMPDGGAACARRIRTAMPDLRLIALTSSEDARLLADVMSAGATSALLKDSSPEQLRDAILATHRGERVIHPRIASLVAALHAVPSRPALSGREQDVLRLIARGLGNADIASELGIGIKTVKTHVSHLLLKLDVEDRTQAAVRALRDGLV